MERSVLVTGGAGFIGSHLVDDLLAAGWAVTALDSFEPDYEEATKRRNIQEHLAHPNYRLAQADVRDAASLNAIGGEFASIVHLAAKPGVRKSLLDPAAYQMTNVVGTQNLLEFARARRIPQFLFASSSSVYGKCERLPWSEEDLGLQPINPYAVSKLAGEHLGHVYHHLYGLKFIALRLFTVYGPRQRPDLAIHKFSRLMRKGEPIPLFGDGTIERDYTYVKDITAGIRAALGNQTLESEIINLGHHIPVSTKDMIAALERAFHLKARILHLPVERSEMRRTWADIGKAQRLLDFRPSTSLEDGLRLFADWSRDEAVRGVRVA